MAFNSGVARGSNRVLDLQAFLGPDPLVPGTPYLTLDAGLWLG